MTDGNGETIVVRGGRHFGDANTIYQPQVAKCSATKQCTIRNYPGEVYIYDGRDSSYRAYYANDFGALADDPPFSSEVQDGYWTLQGIKSERSPRGFSVNEGTGNGFILKGNRVTGPQGIAWTRCDNCQILGTYMDMYGTMPTKGIEGTPFGCSGLFPVYYQVPYATDDPHDYFYDYWQLVNAAPIWAAVQPNGCNDLLVQDTVMKKRHATSVDVFGFETSSFVKLNRFTVVAPRHNSQDVYGAWGDGSGTDAIDIKGNYIFIDDVKSLYGKATMKLWLAAQVNRSLVVSNYNSGETAMAGMSRFYQYASTGNTEFPSNTPDRKIRYVLNDPNNGDAVIITSKISGGIGGTPSMNIVIGGVPGCTGINGEKKIKTVYHGTTYPMMYSIQNLDGSQFSCPDAYDLTQHVFRSTSSVATFNVGTTNITTPAFDFYSTIIPRDTALFYTDGTLPSGLTSGTTYYIIYSSFSISPYTNKNMGVSATRDGSLISFSDAGTGNHTTILKDQRTSYAGSVMTSTYTTSFRNVTTVSANRAAWDLGGGADNRTGTNIHWSINDSIVVSSNTGIATRAYFYVNMPRAYFTNAVSTITLEYMDTNYLQMGATVYFESVCLYPAQIQPYTPYWVKTTNNQYGITISSSPGGIGNALSMTPAAGCAHVNTYLYAPGFTSDIVSMSNSEIVAGSTITIQRGSGDPPPPLEVGATYYVAVAVSSTIGGVAHRHAFMKYRPSDVSTITYSYRPEYRDTSIFHQANPGGNLRNFEVSAFTTQEASDNNIYFGNASGSSASTYCAKNYLYGGNSDQGTCITTAAELTAQEPHSYFQLTPQIDLDETGRATVLTSSVAANKGYYSGTNRVRWASDTKQILDFRAPDYNDQCAIMVSTSSQFTTSTQTIVSPRGSGTWREIVLGTSTAFSPDFVYWHKITCGYDVVTGSATTLPALAGTASFSVHVGSGSATSYVDHGPTDTLGSTDSASCASGCAIPVTANKGLRYYRIRHSDGRQSDLYRTVVL